MNCSSVPMTCDFYGTTARREIAGLAGIQWMYLAACTA
jgi:hypothetical protein